MATTVAAAKNLPRKRFRDDIQGLRGLAVLAVIADHLDVPGLGGGFVGVDVFFVISGFLIVGLMHAEASRTGRISITGFYGRRARRILPAAMLVILCVTVLVHLTLNPLAVGDINQEARWSSLFAMNVLLLNRGADYFGQYDSVSPLQHYWSLGVEEQFYLVMPALFLLTLIGVSRGRSRVNNNRIVGLLLVLSAASLAWCIYSTAQLSATGAYFSSLARAWQIGLGGLLAIAVANRRLNISNRSADALGLFGLSALVLSFVFLRGESYPGFLALAPITGALCVLASGSAATRSGLTQKLLSLRALTLTGLVSFSLYLWHWPVVIFAYRFRPGMETSLVRIPLLLAVALALSALSYAFVERPAKRLSWYRFADRQPRGAQIIRRGVLLTALSSATVVVVMVTLGYWRPTATASSAREKSNAITGDGKGGRWQTALDQSLHLKTIPPNLTPSLSAVPDDREPMKCLSVNETNLHDCRWGSPTATKTVFIIGDSHAQMWFTAIRYAFPKSQYNVQALTKGGCSNSDITRHEPGSMPGAGPACDRHRQWVWEMIARLKPDVVVMSDFAGFVNWTAPDGTPMTTGAREAWQQGLLTSLKQIRGHTGKIVLIGQTPKGEALADCLPKDLALKPCYGDDDYMSGQRKIERAAVEAAGGIFVDPGPWLCKGSSCPPVIDSTVVFLDDNHVTVSMEKKLAPLLKAEIQKGLAP